MIRYNIIIKIKVIMLLLIIISILLLNVSSFSTYNNNRITRRQSKCFLNLSSSPDDFITSFVKKFLPTPEAVGLTRSGNRVENYPAVLDKYAEKLNEDGNDDRALIRQTLAQTNLEFRPLKLLYDADKDGWNAKKFHEKVDKKGPAVVIAYTASGGIIGGYNPTGWVNLGEYRGSIAAFLFLFPNGDTKARPVKLRKISGAGLAQVDDGSGPRFGSEGLTIPLEASNPKLVRSKLGLYYDRLPTNFPNGGRSLLPGGLLEDQLSKLRVYGGVYGAGERIPYSDALPYQLN